MTDDCDTSMVEPMAEAKRFHVAPVIAR